MVCHMLDYEAKTYILFFMPMLLLSFLWVGNPIPSVCDPNASTPSAGFHSNLDGAVFYAPTNVTVGGWAWSMYASNGYAPLNATLVIDGVSVDTMLADIPRAGLIVKTGAPNTEHGFDFQLSPSYAQALQEGKHMVSVEVRPCETCESVVVANSPVCYCNRAPCTCA